MRELIVCRHGESEGNKKGLAMGRGPYPLTSLGRRQAEQMASAIEALDWHPTLTVTSPVPRCVETAKILAACLGAPAPMEEEAFTEIDCGSATGRPFAELRKEHPDFFGRPASLWLGFHELGGESDAQIVERVGTGLDALPREESVLLVTHGAVFKGVLSNLLGLTTQFFVDLRHTTLMRLDRRKIGTSEVVALTHLLHAEEWESRL
ncbi:MAG: histidine phosphatase family protein [Planctomycetota bacterium]